MKARGFILQPTYRIESGRAVVHLWGKLDTGQTFLARDDRCTPHFYILSADRQRARALRVPGIVASDRRTFDGRPTLRVEVPTPPDTPAVRDRLHRAGVQTFEADVRFAMRYLIDRGIRSSLRISGPARPGSGVDLVFENPELADCEWSPQLGVLSLDIETDPEARQVLSVALYGCGTAEVVLVDPAGCSVPANARGVASESELLCVLAARLRELDPDVITGWNVCDFDLAVLCRRATELGTSLEIGRGPGKTRYRPGRSRRDVSQVLVPGRLVLDGIQLLRGAFVRMEQLSLDFVAKQVLGEGKTVNGHDRAEAIQHAFRHDRRKFVHYNLTDARLVFEILERLELVALAVERSRLTGLPPDRVSSSVAAFDFLYLTELGRRKIVAPSVVPQAEATRPTVGGHVFEPEPGLYEHVLVLDFKSLYPSLIRTFQIDPLGYVPRPRADQDLIVTPNGAAFRREAGILTLLLNELIPRREAAQRAGREIESYAIKILMNSFFGVLGTPVCRFFNPEVANAITSTGRELLIWSKQSLEEWGHDVLYGDTDSLFVEAGGTGDADAARLLGQQLVERLNAGLSKYLEQEWHVESRLEIELERLFLRFFLPPVRRGAAGARKRYAGLVENRGRVEVVFTGLEAVRRDWTDLARQTQRELYRRLFFDEPVEEYLRALVAALKEGQLDHLLVYRKALRKKLDAYTTVTPPHVAAARKSSAPTGRLISYVVTDQGPEPVSALRNPIDYQHYVDKQLRPIAAPVLAQLGLDFAAIVGDDHQLELF